MSDVKLAMTLEDIAMVAAIVLVWNAGMWIVSVAMCALYFGVLWNNWRA